MVTGIGSVNAAQFGPERSRTVVMAYDATVLAGTQGLRNHQKTDRLLGIALEQKLPVVSIVDRCLVLGVRKRMGRVFDDQELPAGIVPWRAG